MKCPTTGKPILDLELFTKNKLFRIPGSSKTVLIKYLKCDLILSLHSGAFYMDTRMADRRQSPGTIRRQLFRCARTIVPNNSATNKRRRTTQGTHSAVRDQGRLHPPPSLQHKPLRTIEERVITKMTPWSLSWSRSLLQVPPTTTGPHQPSDKNKTPAKTPVPSLL